MTYCISSEALMYPFNNDALGTTVFNAVKRAYLNVFGDINMDGIESNIMEGQLFYSLIHIRYTTIFKISDDVCFNVWALESILAPSVKGSSSEAFQTLFLALSKQLLFLAKIATV